MQPKSEHQAAKRWSQSSPAGRRSDAWSVPTNAMPMTVQTGNTEGELGLATDDFGVIFAYPWPDEQRLIGNLFERYAAVGAVLVTHHGGQEFRLRRKM